MKSLLALVAFSALLQYQQASGFQSYQALIPNGGVITYNGGAFPGLGHNSASGGGALNAFGTAFKAAGNSWTTALCQADSDGDGYTNGFELGDPACVWTQGGTPSRVTSLSHPGYADSMPVFTPTTVAPTTAAPPALLNDTSVYTIVTSTERFILSDQMSYKWTIDADTEDLLITMTAFGDHYVAIGTAASLMTGDIITCYVNAAGDNAACTDYDGSGYSISAKTSQTTTIVSYTRTNATSYTMTIRAPSTALSVTAWQSQRVIFAIGSYNIATRVASQHSGSGRSAATLNLYNDVITVTGPTAVPPTPTPTPAATTTITLPAGASEQVASQEFTSPEGIVYSWKIQGSGDVNTDVMDFTMTLSSDLSRYVAFGVSSSQMTGPIIVCHASSTTPGGICKDWTGSGLSIAPSSTQITATQSGSVTGSSSYTVTARVKVSDLGINKGGRQRTIFAVGSYDASTDTPSQHSSSGRSSSFINYYAGASEEILEVRKGFTIALIIIIVMSFITLVVAAILNFTRMVFSPTVSTGLRAWAVVLFVIFLALYFALNYDDYKKSVKSFPVQRALGDCAVMSFWFILWPTPKHIGITTVTGSSWERLLSYHIVIGISCWVFATAHFIGMATELKTAAKIFATTGYNNAPLWGFLAWSLTTIMVLFSLFLRRKFYTVFRIMHWLWIPIVVFSILHYNKLLWAFLPPVINLIVDYGVRMYRMCTSDAHIHEVKPIKAAKATKVVVNVNPNTKLPRMGEYMLLGLEGTRFQHPFTVAWVEGAEPENKSSTGGTFASTEQKQLVFCIKNMGEGTWTNQLYENACNDRIPKASAVQIMGPYGSLQVPIGSVEHYVLVCGGIGVTPMLALLQDLSINKPQNIKSVTLVWSLRELALAEELQEYFQRAADDLSGSCPVLINVHTTAKKDGDALSLPKPFSLVQGRPKLPDVLAGLPTEESAAVYVCGPAGLMSDSEAAAKQRPKTFFHSELFEF